MLVCAACQVDGILDAKFTSGFYFTFLCSDFSLEVRVDEDKCMCARRSLHSLDSTSGLRASEGPALGGREGGRARAKEGRQRPLSPSYSSLSSYCIAVTAVYHSSLSIPPHLWPSP